jgi:ABC-type sugar transport system ATPase subunit
MLKIEKMDLTLGRGSALERVLFNQFSFNVAPGEFVIIIGGNGSGKSTLMNIISGFQGVDAGAILLDGKDVTHSKQQDRSRFVSHVMQDPKIGTMESMTIEENMSFALLRGQRRGLARHNTNARRALFKASLQPLGMNLENRLNDFVLKVNTKVVADIGCDHGLLSKALAQSEQIEKVYSIDISKHALSGASSLINSLEKEAEIFLFRTRLDGANVPWIFWLLVTKSYTSPISNPTFEKLQS